MKIRDDLCIRNSFAGTSFRYGISGCEVLSTGFKFPEIPRTFTVTKNRDLNHAQTISLYQPVLHTIAYNILRCKADAEDVVQDTFLKWLSIDQTKIQNTKAYLIGAVTNNCLSHLNALKKKKEEYLDAIHVPEIFIKIKESTANLDVDAELSAAFRVLQHKLEPLERAVYLLKEVFDFSYEDLQKTLDKKKDHCRQLLSRAKKKLSIDSPQIPAVKSKKNDLMDSFKKTCGDFSHAADFVQVLMKDVSQAISNKF